MQDGAPPRCTNAALLYVNDKFVRRVISRRTENLLNAHSLDLNSINFHFRPAAQKQVFIEKLDYIDGLVRRVANFAEN